MLKIRAFLLLDKGNDAPGRVVVDLELIGDVLEAHPVMQTVVAYIDSLLTREFVILHADFRGTCPNVTLRSIRRLQRGHSVERGRVFRRLRYLARQCNLP